MKPTPKTILAVTVLAVALAGAAQATVIIETVPVGNAGNAADTRYEMPGYGAVAYAYNIGKYPVTAGQYTAFLNAVAATDTYGLYNTSMWTDPYGCKIEQDGTPGSYTYSVASDYANRPVTFVSWGDAARFANWLQNDQPTGMQDGGTTETGAYTLNGAMTAAELTAVTRNADWKWAITSEDEWHKAAYYNPATSIYYFYPTGSDTINISMANYDWSVGHATDVGTYADHASPYGTFDQGGNVWEWNEAIVGMDRGMRGGSFSGIVRNLRASSRSHYNPTLEFRNAGFRVTKVPEPGTVVLLALGAAGLLLRQRHYRE